MASSNGPVKGKKIGTKRTISAAPSPAPLPAPAAPVQTGSFPIVGLGASAGGLEAFAQFLRAMPVDSGMGLVLVQHLDPSHASVLTEILQRSTAMPVIEAQDQMVVQPDHVYVIPPNRDMVIFHGALQLTMPLEPRGQRMPIDAFMRSLADDQGERAVGIVLSGTGTDGTLGLRALHGAGGLCLVQDPSTARYDGMPSSAIRAGYATSVLKVDEMPQALRSGTRSLPMRQAIATAPTGAGGSAAAGLSRILMQLRSGCGHDFSQYKKNTIGRRIERRMSLHGIEDVEVYARYLREHPAELQSLFRELLINVTSFFRDPQAFAALKSDVLAARLASWPHDQALRIWVAGCATGEEAYSIAILLREAIDETGRDIKLQFYSTDLDDDAIATARAALYPPNIAQDVSPERLRRFFHKEDAGYRVKAEIRDMVVFAVQSVIKDPPFTRLDLLSCRNLMIYLEPELQNRLIPMFHYALRPGGALFLSPSESIGSHTELLEPIDRKWKLYRRKAATDAPLALIGGALPWSPISAREPAAARADDTGQATDPQLANLARRALLQAFAPAAVITDLKGTLLYIHGETGKYLRPAPGHPTLNVVDMAREGLAAHLREGLHRALVLGLPSLNLEARVKSDGAPQPVKLGVRLLSKSAPEHGLLLISFEDLPTPVPTRSPRASTGKSRGDAPRVTELESELAHAREHLSAMLEEQQASNEELRSTNEELQSTNEELQSTNEELETSKEELQSVNEELVTVNSELQTKVELMVEMQDDMKNLLDNIRLGTIFLDRHLNLRRFTRDASRVYRLQATDVGRPLADIRCELAGDDLLADAQSVLDTLVPVEREVCTTGGIWYLARAQPYRTADNVIDGVVLTFADVTERVNALALRKARDLAVTVVNTVATPLVVLDKDLLVVSANTAFGEFFAVDPRDVVDRAFLDAGKGRWDAPELRQLLLDLLPRESGFEARRVRLSLPTGMRSLRIGARRIANQSGGAELYLLAMEPVADTPASRGPD